MFAAWLKRLSILRINVTHSTAGDVKVRERNRLDIPFDRLTGDAGNLDSNTLVTDLTVDTEPCCVIFFALLLGATERSVSGATDELDKHLDPFACVSRPWLINTGWGVLLKIGARNRCVASTGDMQTCRHAAHDVKVTSDLQVSPYSIFHSLLG